MSELNQFVPLLLAQSDTTQVPASTATMVEETEQEWGIEGTRSQEFSVGIFIFLIISIIVFTAIVVKFMLTGKGKKLKLGEKIMFAWIFLGIVAAIIMGATQLLHGQLF